MNIQRLFLSGDSTVYNLTFIIKGDKVLLGLKKRGFGTGKWNGFGGKLEPGETVTDSAVREIEEECGLRVRPEDLKLMGVNHFEFLWNPGVREVHIFTCDKYEGEIIESEEMLPKWYPIDETPRNEMWTDDVHWFSLLFGEIRFRGYFLFEEHSSLRQYLIVDLDQPSKVIASMNFS
ncbi:unnamed protein product [Allacma fusca]|uniref:Nudix hydrolase domain-containing protein n=1 Tax=Allacma fusca TaxID=39272 RepID=A0A8J2JFH5_9HEXA|nr:unnamed protein product [Allacma fusca]